MKKLVVLALFVGACSRNPAPGTSLTGAVAPKLAAEQFMKAVAAQDLQAMSIAWGTVKGAARDQVGKDGFTREELEKRLIVIQSCYAHDKYVIGEETPAPGGNRMVKVTISRGRTSRTANFELVKGPSDRWYVQDADFKSMQGMCGNAGR